MKRKDKEEKRVVLRGKRREYNETAQCEGSGGRERIGTRVVTENGVAMTFAVGVCGR